MGGLSDRPLGRNLPCPAWHCRSARIYPTSAAASPGASWSGDLVGGEDGPPSLGTWPCTALGLQPFLCGEGAGSTEGTEKDLLPRGVFQGWSVDKVPGQGVPGQTTKRRKGNSHRPRETVPGVRDAAGDSLQGPHLDDPSLTERCPLLASGHLLQGRAFPGMSWLPGFCSPSPSGCEPLTISPLRPSPQLLCQMFCTPSCH